MPGGSVRSSRGGPLASIDNYRYIAVMADVTQERLTASAPAGGLGFFGRFLSIWVAAAIVVGVLIGQFLPAVPQAMAQLEVASVSLPVAVLIWAMIFPMMVQIDFSAVLAVRREPQGLIITTAVNWLIKPFTMFAIAWFFFMVLFSPFIGESLGREYVAGAILLGAAPCTAMVFVWSHLTRGDPAYTLVQVSVNDLIMLVAFAPIVMLLLGISSISVPWSTMLLSVVLYIVIPLTAGYFTRRIIVSRKGLDWLNRVFIPRLSSITPGALLITLVLLFAFQGEVLIDNPMHILLIAIPLTLQTFLIFGIAYAIFKKMRIRYSIAAPGSLIGASNFFELAVATAIALFGLQSPAALVTVVGVLVEVPLMLALVKFANRTQGWFPADAPTPDTKAA
jgi:ACR3 family arsenite transporter